MNQLLLVTILFTVAACATPGPEPSRSESDQAPELAQAPQPVQAPESVQAEESRSDDILAQNDAMKDFKGIEELEAPDVSETPASMIPGRQVSEPAIVCERVVPTGSILPTRVCRQRSDVERKRQADQELFDDIKRNTALGASRL